MISTHVLDTSLGNPAAGITVKLQKREGETWKVIGMGSTNQDGRFSFDSEKAEGQYQIIFEIENYLKASSKHFFFPIAQVVFNITDTSRKYHIPLLLNPFGYSTYRGS